MPFPSPGDLPHPGIEPTFPAVAGEFFTTELPGKLQHLILSPKTVKNYERSEILFCLQTNKVAYHSVRLPRWHSGKESACQCRRLKRCGKLPGVGNRNPLQYSCLENSRDRGTWRATVHRVAKSWTQPCMHVHPWMPAEDTRLQVSQAECLCSPHNVPMLTPNPEQRVLRR